MTTEKPEFYDGTKLLSIKDINGKDPEVYICTTNRTGGKTTYFSRYFVNRFKRFNEKFMLLYRYSYELDGVADKFFKDIKTLFFPNDTMESKKVAKGLFHILTLNGVECGYAVSIHSADTLKKYSHYFNDVERILMDEFQPESNTYLPNEVQKFMSIHTSVARGQGKQVRRVPVFLLGNAVTLINPYYITLGISARLTSEVKFLRGDGWVLEQGFIETASRAQKGSAFNRAFSKEQYAAYSSENIYLHDNKSFVEKPDGPMSRYICTIRYKNKDYAIKEYRSLGILYCDDKPDTTFKYKIAITTDDHNINYVMLKNNDLTISNFRFFYNHGAFRFKDLICKEAVMNMLAY